jgi:ribosomal protein S18 acetylase RimI-like enzyme
MPGHNDPVRAVGVEELRHLPFVRHQVDPTLVSTAWRSGDAAVVHGRRRLVGGTARFATGFGPEAQLGPLLAAVAGEIQPPDRVMVTASTAVVPAAWPLTEVRRWHWMLSTRLLPPQEVPVEEVLNPAEVTGLLDLVDRGSFARPGTPGIQAWLGVRDGAALVAVGAVLRQPDGTGHLRALSVHPEARGRGLGRELSAALTRRAMADTGVCSLGVYVDNVAALRIYRSLGYDVVHTFTSGPIGGRPGR